METNTQTHFLYRRKQRRGSLTDRSLMWQRAEKEPLPQHTLKNWFHCVSLQQQQRHNYDCKFDVFLSDFSKHTVISRCLTPDLNLPTPGTQNIAEWKLQVNSSEALRVCCDSVELYWKWITSLFTWLVQAGKLGPRLPLVPSDPETTWLTLQYEVKFMSRPWTALKLTWWHICCSKTLWQTFGNIKNINITNKQGCLRRLKANHVSCLLSY